MLDKIKTIIDGATCTCMTKTPETKYHKPECKYRSYMDNMKKEQWVKEAYKHIVSITGEWDYPEACMDYCESLYETYVEDELFGEEDCTPEFAVDEDMTYWE